MSFRSQDVPYILIRDIKKCGNRYRGVGHRIISITLNEYIISFYAKPLSIAVAKLINDYMPTQRAAEMGLFFVKERPIVSGENPIFIKHTCYVTGKGQVYFLNKFKSLMAA